MRMALHWISIAMCQREAVTVSGVTAVHHKGLWFYESHHHAIHVGDKVAFTCCGDLVATGYCTEANLDPHDYPKLCSRLNDVGFKGRDPDPEEAATFFSSEMAAANIQ